MTGDGRRGNVGASIRDRLLNKARADQLDFNLLPTRYALERLLYRMSVSEHRDQFLLKGTLLFALWFDIPNRPTHDADFLGFGSAEIPHIEDTFRTICRIDAADGIVFQPETVKAAEIRQESHYAGVRVTLMGLLDSARCPVQVDLGFGDAVTPGAEDANFPVILSGTPEPRIRVYPSYTVVAEKLEALVSLGMQNSRMKDFFDLWVLAKRSEFDGTVMSRAIAATFARRRTPIPQGMPSRWRDFVRRDPETGQGEVCAWPDRYADSPRWFSGGRCHGAHLLGHRPAGPAEGRDRARSGAVVHPAGAA